MKSIDEFQHQSGRPKSKLGFASRLAAVGWVPMLAPTAKDYRARE